MHRHARKGNETVTCQSVRELISPFFDNELDVVQASEVEQHIQTCIGCAELRFQHSQLRSRVRAEAPYYSAPEELRSRIKQALQSTGTERKRPRVPWNWVSFSAAAGFAAAFLLAFLLRFNTVAPVDSSGLIAREVVSSHVRSLMASHLTDVRSTDQHTVKPWFAGKLDFSPKVKDLAAEGFPLTGGRLDYLDQKTVAALVFQRRQHLLNLFVWPSPKPSNSGFTTVAINGFNVVYWSDSGLVYWVVSDLNGAELHDFARLYSE
jgi:anti-sigma factor RsiW